MARAVSSHAWDVASPPAREAAENGSRPATNMRLRPNWSPARPPSSSSPPSVRAYVLITHSSPLSENRSAAWMWRLRDDDDGRVEHDHELGGPDDQQRQAKVAAVGPGAGLIGYGKCRCHATDAAGRALARRRAQEVTSAWSAGMRPDAGVPRRE